MVPGMAMVLGIDKSLRSQIDPLWPFGTRNKLVDAKETLGDAGPFGSNFSVGVGSPTYEVMRFAPTKGRFPVLFPFVGTVGGKQARRFSFPSSAVGLMPLTSWIAHANREAL